MRWHYACVLGWTFGAWVTATGTDRSYDRCCLQISLIPFLKGRNPETAYASEVAFLQKAFRRPLRFFRIDSVPFATTCFCIHLAQCEMPPLGLNNALRFIWVTDHSMPVGLGLECSYAVLCLYVCYSFMRVGDAREFKHLMRGETSLPIKSVSVMPL